MSKWTQKQMDEMIKAYDLANEALANLKNEVAEKGAELMECMSALGFSRREVPEIFKAATIQHRAGSVSLDKEKVVDFVKANGLELPSDCWKIGKESVFFKLESAKKLKGDIRIPPTTEIA